MELAELIRDVIVKFFDSSLPSNTAFSMYYIVEGVLIPLIREYISVFFG